MVHYDENIIRQFAQNLYDQANVTVILFIAVGVLLGGGAGSLLFHGAGMVVGAVVLGFIGYLIGQTRAFQLKLQAQVALCQVQIEQNTRSMKPPSAQAPQTVIPSVSTIPATKPASRSGQRCRDCGADLPRNVEFCPKCSAPVR